MTFNLDYDFSPLDSCLPVAKWLKTRLGLLQALLNSIWISQTFYVTNEHDRVSVKYFCIPYNS